MLEAAFPSHSGTVTTSMLPTELVQNQAPPNAMPQSLLQDLMTFDRTQLLYPVFHFLNITVEVVDIPLCIILDFL